jgi:hypothetical protein
MTKYKKRKKFRNVMFLSGDSRGLQSFHVDLTGMPFMEACDKNIAIIGIKKYELFLTVKLPRSGSALT